MLLNVYKGMMSLSAPLLEAYLKKRARNGKEDTARAQERRGYAARARGEGRLVWFHAASVGESLSLLSIVAKMRAEHPETAIMVTTGTVTSARLMAERLPEGAFHQYVPVDHPLWVSRFLDHWKPDFVVWAESELWPNMLRAIGARGIPAVLLNARMSERSFRRWKWASGAIGQVLSCFSLCLAQNEGEAARLRALGANNVQVSANLKYAAAPLPNDAQKLEALRAQTANRTLLLWASTHPGEEKLALAAHKALSTSCKNLLTIIVPRHPVRGGEIKALAVAAGMKASLRSEAAQPEEVYVADTMGELGLFYRLCKTVVMGGSFNGTGGHNPIEPGQFGCVIFYGPDMHNFITISADFLQKGAAVQVKDADELNEKLQAVLANPGDFASFGAAAEEMTREKSHVVDDLAALLEPFIARPVKEGEAGA